MKKMKFALIMMASGIASSPTFAEVVINGTRIIFNEADRESVVQLKNTGKNPYLLQLWTDDGNASAKPEVNNTPFILNPPVVRIEPNKGQSVRIISTPTVLPKDRESVFWFNMLEIPPKPTAMISGGDNFLQLGVRTRIKIFYRPDGMQTTPLKSYTELKMKVIGNVLNVVNPSPYYITFSKLEIHHPKSSTLLASVEKLKDRMISPKGERDFPLTINHSLEISGLSIRYTVINDYGGESIYEKALQFER